MVDAMAACINWRAAGASCSHGCWMLTRKARMPGMRLGPAWEKLELDHGPAGTRTHLTGTKGLHLQYRWNENRFVGCPVKTVPEGMRSRAKAAM